MNNGCSEYLVTTSRLTPACEHYSRPFKNVFIERSKSYRQIENIFLNWVNLSLFHSIFFIRLYLTLLMSHTLRNSLPQQLEYAAIHENKHHTKRLAPSASIRDSNPAENAAFSHSITFCFVSSLLLTPYLRPTLYAQSTSLV